MHEWRAYVENLLQHSGCGVLRPDLSRVVESNGRLAALAIVTALASETAHLAQIAVLPELRRGGIARTLIADTLKSAHAAGFAQLSLLVSNEHAAASCLYRRLGFVERGEFVAISSLS
jgi:ribosomal protein S18 acetylase RimI-like enzyme